MLKKLVNCLILGSLFTSSAFAGDFLAKVSNGVLSDNSQGVKALNLNEMKQVKGGYKVVPIINGTEMYAIAKYEQGELQYIANYLKGNTNAPQGLCGIDQTSCSNPSKNR
ncbi:bacteriocin, partial [Campylobacter jejuni]